MVAITKLKNIFGSEGESIERFFPPLEFLEGMTEQEIRYNFRRFNGNFDELAYIDEQQRIYRVNRERIYLSRQGEGSMSQPLNRWIRNYFSTQTQQVDRRRRVDKRRQANQRRRVDKRRWNRISQFGLDDSGLKSMSNYKSRVKSLLLRKNKKKAQPLLTYFDEQRESQQQPLENESIPYIPMNPFDIQEVFLYLAKRYFRKGKYRHSRFEKPDAKKLFSKDKHSNTFIDQLRWQSFL